jgi:hypothetical protein
MAPALLPDGLTCAFKQGRFDCLEVTKELIVGAERRYAASVGFGPEPLEGHTEPARDQVQRQESGIGFHTRIVTAAQNTRGSFTGS